MRRVVKEENKRRKEKVKKEKTKSRFEKLNEKIKNIKLDKKKIKIFIIAMIVLVLLIIINNYTALGIVINKNIDIKDAVEVQLQTTIEQILPFENEILVYSKGKISIYNNYGKNTSVIELEDVVDVDIATAGKYIQVINKDKNIVYVYKNKYEVARIKVDGKIHTGNINSDGTSVIEYSSNGSKLTLGIYDNSGDIKYNIRPNKNIIGKYVLSENSKYLAYTDVDVSGISAYTNVNIIDLANVNENESGAKVVYTLDNSLAYDIYWDGRDVITRFDEVYAVYNVSSERVNITEISDGQVVNIGDCDKKYAYTELDINGNYILAVRNMSADKIKTVELNGVPKYFAYENGIIYVCYSKKIEAYNNSCMNIKNYSSDIVITEPVIFNDGRSLAMAISNKLIMFTI